MRAMRAVRAVYYAEIRSAPHIHAASFALEHDAANSSSCSVNTYRSFNACVLSPCSHVRLYNTQTGCSAAGRDANAAVELRGRVYVFRAKVPRQRH